jgi:hypothetical protein
MGVHAASLSDPRADASAPRLRQAGNWMETMHRLTLLLGAIAGAALLVMFAERLVRRSDGWISLGWARTASWSRRRAARGSEPGPLLSEWENEGGSLAAGAQGLPASAETDLANALIADAGTATSAVGA